MAAFQVQERQVEARFLEVLNQAQPGGSVCIIPVPSQHRGRIFLPFADDDKIAEVLSKTLLFARDEEIKDPSILEQLGNA